MTGYGAGEASSGDVTVVCELRSVNNRFRDIQLRCPREYLALEPRVNNLLKDPFTRGRIDAYIRRQVTGGGKVVVANRILVDEYMRVINDLSEHTVGFMEREVPLEFILTQPGVLAVNDKDVDILVEWDVVEAAITAAISELADMRTAEGRALYIDLLGHLGELRAAIEEVEAVSTGINERLRQRLDARLRRLIGDRVEPNRLVQEAALLADKADVSEELARLRSHCDQFAEAMESEDAIGRRLDFLLQEMNREVNTIGSKAAEHPVSHRVVAMKSILERMREQAANVE